MAKFRIEEETRSALARSFAVALCMAVVMLLMAYGFIYIFMPGSSLPLSMAIILLVFALCFIGSAVLLDKNGVGQTRSLVGGAAIALSLTICAVAIGCGIIYLKDNLLGLGWETPLTGLALALVASVVINQLTLKL